MTTEEGTPGEVVKRRGRPRKNVSGSGQKPVIATAGRTRKAHVTAMSEAFIAGYNLGLSETNS